MRDSLTHPLQGARTYLFHTNRFNLERDMFKGLGISITLIVGGMVALPAAIVAAL